MKKGISAKVFMATISTAGRVATPAFPIDDNNPATLTVEQWDGTKFVERLCVWTGERYEYAEVR